MAERKKKTPPLALIASAIHRWGALATTDDHSIARTQLNRLGLRADVLDRCIAYLAHEGLIAIEVVPSSGASKRSYTTYRSLMLPEQHVAQLNALPAQPPDSFITPQRERASERMFNRNAQCYFCQAPLAPQQAGRRRKFCNLACRSGYLSTTSTYIGSLLSNAPVHRRLLIAFYLVAAELAAHGGTLLFHTFQAQAMRIHYNGKWVNIHVARSTDPQDVYQSQDSDDITAVVMLDGNIQFRPPFDDEFTRKAGKGAAPSDDESDGA